MPDFPRDILPELASEFNMPGALRSIGPSGKVQARSIVQAGRTWIEVWPLMSALDWRVRKLLTKINQYWVNGTVFQIQHYHHLTPLGSLTGTLTVNGANQTGTSIITTGAGGSNPGLRSGDIIRLPGISKVFDVADDCNRVGAALTIPINPPIYVGGSPTNGGTVLYTGVILNAMIDEMPDIPLTVGYYQFEKLTIKFREAV